jgi:hypothetical protein
MIVLNRNDAKILFFLRDKGVQTPSNLGILMKFKIEDAAAHMTKPLRRLVDMGLIRKEAKNKRVVQYRCIKLLPPMVITDDSPEKIEIRKADIHDDPYLPGLPNGFLPDALRPVTRPAPALTALLGKVFAPAMVAVLAFSMDVMQFADLADALA